MRLALLGYYHETNTFSSRPTDYAAFEIQRGDEIVRDHIDATSSLAGFLSIGKQPGVEVVKITNCCSRSRKPNTINWYSMNRSV